ncbi:uncharacterized protein LOC126882719 [Diabrotica virgifera virgifera]|uniref:Uncharacterized protein n=1 Tax=Diabrotica virgifera virgifera TaxID=50390 RepID=A0ABM5K0E6_DIAVI|nr:uncharacterized protein LOC126882719 [Diabrotica virgifera virgifera]
MTPIATNPQQTATDSSQIVAKKIQEIWSRASIPTIQQCSIIKRITSYRLKIRNLLKPYKQRSGVASYKKQLNDFRTQSKVLFDVAACKCLDLNNCSCDKVFKVPAAERPFLEDQRTQRRMVIGAIDITMSKKLQNREERNLLQIQKQLNENVVHLCLQEHSIVLVFLIELVLQSLQQYYKTSVL